MGDSVAHEGAAIGSSENAVAGQLDLPAIGRQILVKEADFPAVNLRCPGVKLVELEANVASDQAQVSARLLVWR